MEQGWSGASICEAQGIMENTDNVAGIKLDNFSVSKPPRKSEEEQGQSHTEGAQRKASFSCLSERFPNRKMYRKPDTRKRNLG